jgi:hypothetical protein
MKTLTILPAALVLVLFGALDLAAQATLPAAAQAKPAPAPRYRRLAPGVEKTIPADRAPSEQLSVHNLNELLTLDPTYGERPGTEGQSPAKNVRVAHDNWALDFTFKPLRFMRVDVPNGHGRLASRLVWYLVYHVRNPATGAAAQQAVEPAAGANAADANGPAKPVRFIPVFWLQSGESGQLYPDKLIPVAVPYIQRREDPNRRLLNTAEIEGEIAPGQEVWGVVTWDDIDPAIDRFSILVQGLSGAYQWTDSATAAQAGGAPQRQIKLKTLQLNFWRPGDAFYEHESEIRFGAPGDVDYRWVYR